MNIDSIKNGIVIDHIQAKKGMEIYEALNLKELDCSVAIITNAKSRKMGRKDIIKIDKAIDINMDVIGYIDPEVTINIVENDKLVNICVDINGQKGPNIVGRDLFFIAIYNNGMIDTYSDDVVSAPLTEDQRSAGNVMWKPFGDILNANWQMDY